MKLEVGDVVKIARRRWYLEHRKEYYASFLTLILCGVLLLGGLVMGDQDYTKTGSTWEWNPGAVVLFTLVAVAITGWLTWLVSWQERRSDFVRLTLAKWLETEKSEAILEQKKVNKLD